MKILSHLIIFLLISFQVSASRLLIPMDQTQSNHLKAYGMAYWVLQQQMEAEWLLNYRGGSFLFPQSQQCQNELVVRNIYYEVLSDADVQALKAELMHPESNTDIVKLETPPKIAVYSPPGKQPWDDAVTLVLTYAEIPYDIIFDDEVMNGLLPKYDWLHLHHEDFTGQYGKFYTTYGQEEWYKQMQRDFESCARRHGFSKVSDLKGAVAKRIRDFCLGGGFLFAMCSATDTYDIALAAEGIDICETMYDGDPCDLRANDKLNYQQTFAFKDFTISLDPYQYEYSNIDNQSYDRGLREENDYFSLFSFSAKWDPIPTMLTQNHERLIKGFMGQTTAFRNKFIKSDVIILADNKTANEARYLHGSVGKGTWTFYGGHDPEDYRHFVGEAPTDLSLHPNSPGYRLILNNILFPAAKKKPQKT